MIGTLATKLLPIIQQVSKRMVGKNFQTNVQEDTNMGNEKLGDMRTILGFISQKECIKSLNIDDMMSIEALTLKDLMASYNSLDY